MGDRLFLVITYISSRHETSGYHTRAKAVSYTRQTRIATSVTTRLAVTMHISMVHF